jgi:hypothetical protein
MLPAGALLAALLMAALPRARVAAAQASSSMCAECIGSYVAGEDAAGGKDLAFPGCDGACHCHLASSPCFDKTVGAAMKPGSLEHKAACCGLCSVTAGCRLWVISTGLGPVNADNQVPSCWCKTDTLPLNPGQPQRGHGMVAQGFGPSSCASRLGGIFSAVVLVGGALYVGGGVVYGARAQGRGGGGGGRRLMLSCHPHHGVWVQLAALVSDGIAFVRGRLLGGGGGGGGSRQRLLESGGSARPSHGERGGKEKKERKADKKEDKNKSRRHRRSSSGSSSGPGKESMGGRAGSAEGLVAPVAAAPSSAPQQGINTPAGGGGRWVHVS